MCEEVAPKRREKTPEQALSALMRYCSRAERSSGDAIRLMRGWSIMESEQRKIITCLREQKFIDDERFAMAYVKDKINFIGWGAYKIRAGLRTKGIPADIIERALAGLDDVASRERLRELLARRAAAIRTGTLYERRAKLLRYGASRGFDYETLCEVIEEITG